MSVKMGWIQIKMGHPLARNGAALAPFRANGAHPSTSFTSFDTPGRGLALRMHISTTAKVQALAVSAPLKFLSYCVHAQCEGFKRRESSQTPMNKVRMILRSRRLYNLYGQSRVFHSGHQGC